MIELGRNTGFAFAANRGIDAVDSQAVALVNTDVVLAADWIERMAAALAHEDNVGAVMTRKVTTCTEADTIASLMERMTEGKFRHLPVVEQGRLAGIISIGDVVKHRLQEMESEQSALRDYIQTA